MRKKTISIAVCAIVSLALCISIFLFGKSSSRVNAAEVEQKTLSWIEIISNIERKPSYQSAFPNPATYPDEFYEIYKIGYAAAPYLIQHIIDNNMNNVDGAFIVMAAANNLHLNYLPGAIKPTDENPVYSNDEDAYTPVWYAKQLQKFAKEAPEEINKICDSDIPMAEKMLKLEEYGMLAVPILQEKMNSGDTQWSECVLNLSLSPLNEEERFKLHVCGFEDEILYSSNRDELIHQRKVEALEGSSFNKRWFRDHADELALMSQLFK